MGTTDPSTLRGTHEAPATRWTSGAPTSFVRTAGLSCLVGALIGVVSALVTAFIPPSVSSERYSYPYTPTGFVMAEMVFIVNHVLLLVGMLGLARSGAVGTGRLGRTGLWISISGMAALTLCEVRAARLANDPYPSPSTDALEGLFGVASVLIGLGLVLAGIAVVRARHWAGWHRFVALTCGVAVFVIVIPGVFGPFLAGRLVLAVWMLMFAALGAALLRALPSRRPCSPVTRRRWATPDDRITGRPDVARRAQGGPAPGAPVAAALLSGHSTSVGDAGRPENRTA